MGEQMIKNLPLLMHNLDKNITIMMKPFHFFQIKIDGSIDIIILLDKNSDFKSLEIKHKGIIAFSVCFIKPVFKARVLKLIEEELNKLL